MPKEMLFLRNLPDQMNSNASSIVCFSHIGKRKNPEDNFLINTYYLTTNQQKKMLENFCYFSIEPPLSKVRLYGISDGMGGYKAGEVASRICIEKLAQVQKELQRCNSLKETVAYLQKIIAEINNTINQLSCTINELEGMGATLVLLVAFEKEYAVLNIGDSRAYYFNDDRLTQITTDHTEGQRMLDLGLLTKKELSKFPARKSLNRFIGYESNGCVLQADEFYPVLKDGIVLLCSDGISDFLTDNRIFEILSAEKNMEEAGKKLINEAIDSCYADNATLILIKLRRMN